MLLLVFSDLFLQIFRQFLRPLVERVVVPQIFVHRVSSVVELRFQFFPMRFRFSSFGRQRFLFSRPGLEQLERVFQFFV